MATLGRGIVNTILSASATGNGATYSVPLTNAQAGDYNSTYAWQTNVTGGPTALSCTLEGSLDGTTWLTIDTNTATTSALRVVNLANTNAGPYAFLRAALGTLTGGTSPTVTILLTLGRT